jgi:hypothetical protein
LLLLTFYSPSASYEPSFAAGSSPSFDWLLEPSYLSPPSAAPSAFSFGGEPSFSGGFPPSSLSLLEKESSFALLIFWVLLFNYMFLCTISAAIIPDIGEANVDATLRLVFDGIKHNPIIIAPADARVKSPYAIPLLALQH